QDDVDQLQRQVFDMKKLVEQQSADVSRVLALVGGDEGGRKQLAEFNANVESLRGDIRALASRFDDTTARLSALERRVQALGPAPAAQPALTDDGGPAGAGLAPGAISGSGVPGSAATTGSAGAPG